MFHPPGSLGVGREQIEIVQLGLFPQFKQLPEWYFNCLAMSSKYFFFFPCVAVSCLTCGAPVSETALRVSRAALRAWETVRS